MALLRQKKRKKSFLPRLIIFLIIVWAASGIYFSYKATEKIEKLNTVNKEVKILRIIKFFPSYSTELNNINKILKNENPGQKTGWLFTSTYRKITTNLLKLNQLKKFNKLMEYLYNRKEKPELNYFYGLYLFNKGKFEQAKPFLKDKPTFKKIYSSQKIPVIKGILDYDLKERKYHAKYKSQKFLESIFPRNRDFLITYQSTIIPEIQDIAEITIGENKGFFAFAKQGEILALVANGINPVEDFVEPASVIKLITSVAYLSENRNDVKFPFICKTPLNIDGKLFYDWKAHGKLNSIEDALACSCNLVFGECGLSLGKTALLKWYSRFYIDKNKKIKFIETSFIPAITKKNIKDRYSLAMAAVGLDIPEVTPYWLIKTASTFARGGRDSFPTIVRWKSVLGIEDSNYAIENMTMTLNTDKDFIFDFQKVKPVYTGMEKAVETPIGTGRRAKVNWIKLLLKTGTGGDRPNDSVIVGVAKYKNADYSFALFLKKGGKAEFKAARMIHNFFKSYKNVFFSRK